MGEADRFAAWRVQERTDTQLLMKAVGATSSWFMIEKIETAEAPGTRLFFGSVIAPAQTGPNGTRRIGAIYSALLGFHVLYSKLLLASAKRRLARLSG